LARRLVPLGLAALVATFAAIPADAGPAACRQIERQLAGAGSQPRDARRYDRAIRAQQVELQKVQAQLANAGCSGFMSVLRSQCGSLEATVRRMEANLGSLQQGRAGLRTGPDAAERAQLLASYERSGCNDGASEVRTSALPQPKRDRPALYDNLFGDATPQSTAAGTPPGEGSPQAAGEPRRALCVRTCDGYFFPIAYSTTEANFTSDQQRCEAACPGTDVELYYDRIPGDDGTAMMSGRTGAPYSALPSAFLYKKAGYQRPLTCGCNPQKGFSVVAGQQPLPADPAAQAQAATPAPAIRPISSEGSVVAVTPLSAPEEKHAAVAEPSGEKTSSVDAEPEPKRNVRVVGPKFLPDPDEAIDLRAPARRQ
jgi:hypothetical protein